MCNTKTRWNTSKELTSEGHLTGESELRVISLKTNNKEDWLRFNIEIFSWDLLVDNVHHKFTTLLEDDKDLT